MFDTVEEGLMAEIIAAMASSHAYTFYLPEQWDERREVSRARFAKKYGSDPPILPELDKETLEGNQRRFKPIREGLDTFKATLPRLQADTLVLIGDDQNENYREFVPQFSIYTGERIVSADNESNTTFEVPCDAELARRLVEDAVEAGFDVAFSRSFPEDRLLSHAHAQILNFLRPQIPVVLVFVNSICPPAPTPARCYQFGRALRGGIERFGQPRKIVAYASGGLSHFSAGYPYEAYGGPRRMGAIAEDLDKQVVDWIVSGRAEQLGTLTSKQLIDNGGIEYRQWITLMGMLDARKPDWLHFGAFYRGIMGMGVAYWQLN
jgi:aromatic ring-opening dioxygenase LigB subunit